MLPEFATSPFVQAAGLALLHFLWQGTAIGLATAAILALCRRNAARLRYAIGCGSLAMMTAAVVATATAEFRDSSTTTIVASGRVLAEPFPPRRATDTAVATATQGFPLPDSTTLPFDLNAWLPTIVICWMAGVLLIAGRLLVGWFRVRTLTRDAVSRTAPLQAAVERMAAALHIARMIDVRESHRLSVPTVVGWMRPVLLMPVAVVAELSPAQLEAIVAHELAHIRRYDHVVNGLQTLIETVLFYHPAVWWVSREVRREREHCCDEIALHVSGDRVLYASTLTTLEERRQEHTAWRLAATDGDLLARIQRILGVPMTPSPYSTTWTAAAVALGLTGFLATVVASQPQPPPDEQQVATAAARADAGAVPTGNEATKAVSAPAAQPRATDKAQPAAAPPKAFDLDADYRLMSALNSSSAETVRPWLAEDFVSTNSNGAVLRRDPFLASIAASPKADAVNLQTHNVRRVSDTRWVVTGTQEERKGQDRKPTSFMRVWQWSGTGWHVVSTTSQDAAAAATVQPITATPVTAASTIRVRDESAGINRAPRLQGRPFPGLQSSNVTVRDSLKSVALIANLDVTFDQGLDSTLTRPLTLDITGPIDLETALTKLLMPQQLTYKILDARSIFVYQDNPVNRMRYEDQYIQAFKLKTEPSAMLGILRQLLAGLQIPVAPQISADNDTGTLYVRAAEEQLRLIQDFIKVNDRVQ